MALVPIATARGSAVGSQTSVEGTVTALPGRILGDGLLILQEGGAGIAVQLPAGFDESTIALGRILRVTGKLADPYANLELRPAKVADVAIVGDGGVPSAVSVRSTDLTESREGTLVRASGVISRVETGTSGSLAVTLRDDAGEMRVFAFGALGLAKDAFPLGASLRVTGVVGQRESSSGAGDGYRVWPRDRADIAVTAPSATSRPAATQKPGSATPRPTATPKPTSEPEPPLVRVSAAKDGDTVTIQGTVTSAVGLFDSDERRVTVQDGSGAVLVRLPDGASGPKVGTRLKVRGEVGTWFSARQLEADATPIVTGKGSTLPVVLRRTPREADEWRLVRVTVRITKVTKDGDAWRAEASLGAAGTLPIVGLARSGIAADALVEGRDAVVTGIVKRAHPSATDQRFGIAPRDARDIRLGAAPRTTGGSDGSGSGGSAGSGDGSSVPDPLATAAPGSGGTANEAPIGTSIRSAAALVGRRVRVAGALRAIDTPLLTLDDGSGRGLVRLLDFDPAFQPPLHLGEVVNVTGTVATRDVGGWEIVARADGIVRAAGLSLGTGSPMPSTSPATPVPSPGGQVVPTAPSAEAADGGDGGLGRLVFAVVVGLGVAALATVLAGVGVRSSRRRTAAARQRDDASGGPGTHEPA
ncbi:MAG: hypothetical protein U0667_12555 [Chloroflexota bacterium]